MNWTLTAMFFWRKREPIPSYITDIIQLLKQSPQDWKFDQFHATHIGGAQIWIANGDWALSIKVPEVGTILHQAEALRPTASHRAVFKAVQQSRTSRLKDGLSEYLEGFTVSPESRACINRSAQDA